MSEPKHDTIELDAVAFTADQIQLGLENWARNLAKARADGDILAADTALRFIDCWLDRKNQAKP